MKVKCSKCNDEKAIIFRPNKFGKFMIKDATRGVYYCLACGNCWTGLKYWRVKYENVEVER